MSNHEGILHLKFYRIEAYSREARDVYVSDHNHPLLLNCTLYYDNLITHEAGEVVRTSRGSNRCSNYKISLYTVQSACSADHCGTRISSFQTKIFAQTPLYQTLQQKRRIQDANFRPKVIEWDYVSSSSSDEGGDLPQL